MTRRSKQTAAEEVELAIPLQKVCFIIMKAHAFDAKDVETDVDSGSNPSDDGDVSVLEDHADDPTLEELRSLISELSVDEQIDLVALTWLGRDEFPDEWDEVRAAAAEAHNRRTAAYLLGNPLLGDHLSEGLERLGLSCAAYEAGRA